jgi:hypothetical protein
VRFGRASKKRTREKRTTKTVQNTCTTIVMLPSPRSLFFSIELGGTADIHRQFDSGIRVV